MASKFEKWNYVKKQSKKKRKNLLRDSEGMPIYGNREIKSRKELLERMESLWRSF